MNDIVTIGDATLYHGDCMEILPTLGKVDAVVTDPPYGIGTWNDRSKTDGTRFKNTDFTWDEKPSKETVDYLLDFSKEAIIFGFNHLSDMLPATKKVLIWDKTFRGLHFNDCELIACYGCGEACRIYSYNPSKARRKEHPTEKPLAVMEWVLDHISGNLVIDPFMGSGTTGVACTNFDRKFIGIEKERKYFEIACDRIDAAYAQGRLAL